VVGSSPKDILHIPTHIDLLEDLVALINNKVLNTRDLEALVADESVHSTGGTDNDVRALGLVLKHGLVFGDGRASVDNTGADIGHVLGETGVLVSDLIGKLASVAKNKDGDFAVDGLDLLKGSEDEDGGFTHTRLGLADDVHAENGLRDAFLLDYSVEAGKPER